MSSSHVGPVLFAAADPGGAAAVLPVAVAAAAEGQAVLVLEHGFLGANAPPELVRVSPPAMGGEDEWLARLGVGVLCFGTSLADPLPLALARAASAAGVPVACVLDNWMNYRARLETDGGPMLVPEIYAVMDDKAAAEAEADGVPPTCLKVTGHPGLAGLAALGGRAGDPRRVAFIGEPVTRDQGDGPHHPGWRGYTERDALALLCRVLQPHASDVELTIVPHPRDDVEALSALWRECRGRLTGEVAAGMPGRQAVREAGRVAGMASILLYEAWVLGRPVLSLQPGLVRPDLAAAVDRPGIRLVRRAEQAEAEIAGWLAEEATGPRLDGLRHGRAPRTLATLLRRLKEGLHGQA